MGRGESCTASVAMASSHKKSAVIPVTVRMFDYGFKLSNGKRVFRYKTGAYHPVISDGRRLYLTGYSSVNALQPVKAKPKKSEQMNGKSASGGAKKKKKG